VSGRKAFLKLDDSLEEAGGHADVQDTFWVLAEKPLNRNQLLGAAIT
jgi:hypothetical protein